VSFEDKSASYALQSAAVDASIAHISTTTAVVTNTTTARLFTIFPFVTAMIYFAAASKHTTTAHPYTLDCSTAVNTTIDIMAASASNISTTNALTPANQQKTAHLFTDTGKAPYMQTTARMFIVESFPDFGNSPVVGHGKKWYFL
jgi:hypothetical protein